MTPAAATTRRRRGDARAFTLLELLVVVGVIALLVAIVLSVGPKLLSNQQKTLTMSAMRALDGMLEEYVETQGGALPAFDPGDYEGVPGADLKTVGDGFMKTSMAGRVSDRTFSEHPSGSGLFLPRFPDAAVFIKAARGCCEVADQILADMPDTFVRSTVMPEDNAPTSPADEMDGSPSVLDAWGSKEPWDAPFVFFDVKPVLFVHPSNTLAQSLYGKCLNGRPYFMSAGADRLYGTTNELREDTAQDGMLSNAAIKNTQDNVYSYTPGPLDNLTGSEFNLTKR